MVPQGGEQEGAGPGALAGCQSAGLPEHGASILLSPCSVGAGVESSLGPRAVRSHWSGRDAQTLGGGHSSQSDT